MRARGGEVSSEEDCENEHPKCDLRNLRNRCPLTIPRIMFISILVRLWKKVQVIDAALFPERIRHDQQQTFPSRSLLFANGKQRHLHYLFICKNLWNSTTLCRGGFAVGLCRWGRDCVFDRVNRPGHKGIATAALDELHREFLLIVTQSTIAAYINVNEMFWLGHVAVGKSSRSASNCGTLPTLEIHLQFAQK